MPFDLNTVLGLVRNAGSLVQQATDAVDALEETGTILSSQSEEEIEKAIADLEALLPGLRASTQAKLLGSTGSG